MIDTPPLTPSECLQIFSCFTFRAPCGPPARFLGSLPIRWQQVTDEWRQHLSAVPHSPTAQAAKRALTHYAELLKPVAARQELVNAVEYWRTGAVIASLREALDAHRRRNLTRDQARSLMTHLGQCVAALSRPCHLHARRPRLGRFFRKLERHIRPLVAWWSLAERLSAFEHHGRLIDVDHLYGALDALHSADLSPRQREQVQAICAVLLQLPKNPPKQAELQNAIETFNQCLQAAKKLPVLQEQLTLILRILVLGNYLSHEKEALHAWSAPFVSSLSIVQHQLRRLAQRRSPLAGEAKTCAWIIDRYLKFLSCRKTVIHRTKALLKGPAPGISPARLTRWMTQMDRLVRQLHRTGLQRIRPYLQEITPSSSLRGVVDLPQSRKAMEHQLPTPVVAVVQSAAKMVADCSVQPPSSAILELFLTECAHLRATMATHRSLDERLATIACALVNMADWIVALRTFIHHRLSTWGTTQARDFRQFLDHKRFAIAPPATHDAQHLTPWLLTLPEAQRDAVLEFIYLGPVRREVVATALRLAATEPQGTSPPFSASPLVGGNQREQARRRASLELLHSLWRAELLDDSDYREIIAQHWRRPTTHTERFDRDRRRPSIVEYMMQYAKQIHDAALEAGDRPPSLVTIVEELWRYLREAAEINARWRDHVPTDEPRRRAAYTPRRIEADSPHEIIEHVRIRTIKFYDLADIVDRAQRALQTVTDEELHAVRAVDLLLFDLFGDRGMLLPSQVYAWPLAETTQRGLLILRPLAPHDAQVQRACTILEQLAPFYAEYNPTRGAISTPWANTPEVAIRTWRDLLEEIHDTARRRAQESSSPRPLASEWRALAQFFDNRRLYLRLQLAMRVAVDRDDPSCRYLAASLPQLAQLDAERIGLAQRRRLHPRSEAAIIANKLLHRSRLLAAYPTSDQVGGLVSAFVSDCQRLVDLHRASPDPQIRTEILACRNQIEERLRTLRAVICGSAHGLPAPKDTPLYTAAQAAVATAHDLVDGFYIPNHHKGLRSLIPLRWGEALDDTLSRV